MTAGSYLGAFAEELWRHGLDLEAAARRFAPRSIREKSNIPFPKISTEGAKELSPEAGFLETLAGGLTAIRPVLDVFTERNKAFQEMRDHLVSLVIRSQLKAFGYALPRQTSDKPIEIPQDIWPGQINWEKSEICGNGLEFVAVKVISKTLMQKLMTTLPPNPEPKPAGRPSVKRDINEAYQFLKDANLINFSKPRTACDEQIRNWLAKQYPDRAGIFVNIADETIRIHIGDKFNAEKAALKS